MTIVRAVPQIRPARWRDLICLLSLLFVERFYPHLGCPIEDYCGFQELAAGVVRDHPNAFKGRAGESFVTMREDFIDRLIRCFGRSREELFLTWVTLVWNELDGPTWDWFAYEFAFSDWYNKFSVTGTDSFSLGPRAGSVAELFRNTFLQEVNVFRQERSQWPELPVSPWDRTVLDLAGWRLGGTGPEEVTDFSGVVSGPIRAHYFQEFWRVLLAEVGQAALLPMRSEIEVLIKRETSFPDRALLAASDLPMVPQGQS